MIMISDSWGGVLLGVTVLFFSFSLFPSLLCVSLYPSPFPILSLFLPNPSHFSPALHSESLPLPARALYLAIELYYYLSLHD